MDKELENIIQNQIALFNFLGALVEKMTGQKPSVSMEQDDGSLVKMIPTTSFVTWVQEVEQGSSCPFLKEKPKDSSPDGVPCAEQLNSPQSA